MRDSETGSRSLGIPVTKYKVLIFGLSAFIAGMGGVLLSFVLEQAKDPFGKVFASSFGVGAQWRNILPGWDAGLDLRYVSNAARDRLLASDPPGVRPDIFRKIPAATLYLSRKF